MHVHPDRHPQRSRCRHVAAARGRRRLCVARRGRQVAHRHQELDVPARARLHGRNRDWADARMADVPVRSGVAPVALLGVIGGPLLATSGDRSAVRRDQPQSAAQSSTRAVPEILWEAFLGLWLTFKGFRRGCSRRRDCGFRVRAIAARRPMRSSPPIPSLAAASRGARLRPGSAPGAAFNFKEIHMIVVDNSPSGMATKTAVDGLTFTVQPGMVTGFLGPNGSGKSTTMRLILGLARADKWHRAPVSGTALRGTQGAAPRCRCPPRGACRPSGTFRVRSPPRAGANTRDPASTCE